MRSNSVSNHTGLQVVNHYTVSIKSSDLSRGYIIDRRVHKFDQARPNFITSATISFIPKRNQPILDNVLQDNIIKVNTVPHVISKGCYGIADLVAEINDILIDVGSVSVITEGSGFGLCKLYIQAYNVIDFSEAPDILDILKLDPVYSVNANKTYTGNAIVDITRNLQNIQIFCSMLQASSCKIANSYNDLLCTVAVESLEQTCTERISKLMIPIYPLVNYVEIIFRNQEGLTLNLNCEFLITLHISSFNTLESSVSSASSLTNLCLECRSANNDIELNQTYVLPQNSYISRVSMLFTGAINNISVDQEICIDGEYITIKKGMYTLETLLSELNTLNAVFTVLTEGKDAFKIQVSNFSYISFLNAQQIKEILGFEYDHISLKTEGKRYVLDSSANRLVIHRVYQDDNVVLTLDTGIYNFDEFIELVKEKLSQYIKLKSVEDRGTYLEFVSNDKFYFDREKSTIHNYPWTSWFNFDPSLRNHYIEKPDMNFDRREDNIFMNDDQYIQIDYELGVNDVRYFMPTNFKINVNDDTTLTIKIEGNYTRKSLADYLCNQVNHLYKTLGYTDNITRVINNDEIVLVEGQTKYFKIEALNSELITGLHNNIVHKIADNDYKVYKWPSSESFCKEDNVKLPQDIHYKFKIDDKEWIYRSIPKGTHTINNIRSYVIGYINTWINNNTSYTNVLQYMYNAEWSKGRLSWRHNGSGTLSVEFDYPIMFSIQGKPVYSILNHKGNGQIWCFGPYSQDIFANLNNREYSKPTYTGSIPHIYNDFNYTRLPVNHTWIMNRMKELSMGLITVAVCNESEFHIPYRFSYKNNPTKIYFCDKDKKVQTPLLMSKGYIETMANITGFFRNLTYNVYNIFRKTLTIKIEGVEHELNPNKSYITQYALVQRLNQLLTDKNIPIQWRLGKEGYYLQYDKGIIELSGSLASFLGCYLIKTNANKYVLKYVDNCVYFSGDGYSKLLSDYLVNLTNNKEVCNIYCSLIKGKLDNLLTSLEITDLTKNYKSISNLQIPINNTFDSIQVNLRDANDEYYDFNGVLYIMLSLNSF